MPKVEKTTIEDNVYRISILLEKDEYKNEFTKKLKEYRKTAQWKGFRKGAAPIPFVKKMVGPQIFHELIGNLSNKALYDFVEGEKLNYIGSPIPSVDVEQQVVTMNMDEDISFSYDIAVVPEKDLKEPTDHTFTLYKVNDLDKAAKKELETARLSLGKMEEVQKTFDDKVTLTLKLTELEGKKTKEGGIVNEVDIPVAMINNDDTKKELKKAKVGDSFILSPFADLTVKDEKQIASQYLGMNPDYEGELPQSFQAEIIKAVHKIPADLNKEFFDQVFGPDVVDSEEKAVEKFIEFFESKYKHEADQILLINWKKYLQENNIVDLPSEYIKKIITTTNDGIDEEALNKDLPIIEKDLLWSGTRLKLVAKYEVPEASEHDIQHAIAHSIGSQYGIDPHHEIITNIAKDTMKKDKQKVEATYYGIMEGRLFDKVKDSLKTKEEKVSTEKFGEILADTFK